MDGRLEWTVWLYLKLNSAVRLLSRGRRDGWAGVGGMGRCSSLAAVAATFAEQQILPCFKQFVGLSSSTWRCRILTGAGRNVRQC